MILCIPHKKFFVANKKTLICKFTCCEFAKIILTSIIWPNNCFILLSKLMEVPGIEHGASHMQSTLYRCATPPFSCVLSGAVNQKCFYGHKSFFRNHSIDLVVFPCLQLIQIYLLWSGEYERPQPNEVEWMEVQNLSGTHLEWWLKLYSSFTRCLHCIMIVAIRAFSYQSFQCFMVYQR